MNLTANIPFDFTDMEACKQVIKSIPYLQHRIQKSNLTLINGESNDGPFPMTQEEIEEVKLFLENLTEYCSDTSNTLEM